MWVGSSFLGRVNCEEAHKNSMLVHLVELIDISFCQKNQISQITASVANFDRC